MVDLKKMFWLSLPNIFFWLKQPNNLDESTKYFVGSTNNLVVSILQQDSIVGPTSLLLDINDNLVNQTNFGWLKQIFGSNQLNIRIWLK